MSCSAHAPAAAADSWRSGSKQQLGERGGRERERTGVQVGRKEVSLPNGVKQERSTLVYFVILSKKYHGASIDLID